MELRVHVAFRALLLILVATCARSQDESIRSSDTLLEDATDIIITNSIDDVHTPEVHLTTKKTGSELTTADAMDTPTSQEASQPDIAAQNFPVATTSAAEQETFRSPVARGVTNAQPSLVRLQDNTQEPERPLHPSHNCSDLVVNFYPPLLTVHEGFDGYVFYNISCPHVMPPSTDNLRLTAKDPEIIELVEHKANSHENMVYSIAAAPRPFASNGGAASGDDIPASDNVAPPSTYGSTSGYISLKGRWIGRTQVTLTIPGGPNGEEVMVEYPVRVLRPPNVIDKIFNTVLTIAIFCANFMFGCLLDLSSAKEILRRPVAPIIGFFCQYTVMPATSFLVGWGLGLSLPLRLGLLAMGCSPGGGNSNTWTLNLNGDVTLSLVMTFISNICALFMMPMWLLTLGQFLVGSTIDIPFVKIITALAFFVIPILIGLGLTKWKPIVGKIVRKIVRPYTLLQALFMITIGLWSNWYIFRFCADWRLPVAGMTLPYVGMIIGMIVATIFRQGRARIITIGIETAFQNGALALVIMRRSLPQPEADIASVAPIIAAILTPLPAVLAFIVLIIKTKCIDRVRGKGAYAKAPTEDKHEGADANANDPELKRALEDGTA